MIHTFSIQNSALPPSISPFLILHYRLSRQPSAFPRTKNTFLQSVRQPNHPYVLRPFFSLMLLRPTSPTVWCGSEYREVKERVIFDKAMSVINLLVAARLSNRWLWRCLWIEDINRKKSIRLKATRQHRAAMSVFTNSRFHQDTCHQTGASQKVCGFGGLEVACWAFGNRVRGFAPGRGRRIFKGEKNPQRVFF
jgi:hypothetical protein